MAGHFPFAGKRGTRYGLAPRGTLAAFFENNGFNNEMQEKYYEWWYGFAKDFVTGDSDLSATMGVRFHSYPMGIPISPPPWACAFTAIPWVPTPDTPFI